MSKPTGTFRCRACGRTWDGSELYEGARQYSWVWCCGDLFCGGTVDKISDESRKGD